MQSSTNSGFLFPINCSHLTQSLNDLISFHHRNLLLKSTFLAGDCRFWQQYKDWLRGWSSLVSLEDFHKLGSEETQQPILWLQLSWGNGTVATLLSHHLTVYTTASACTTAMWQWPNLVPRSWMPPHHIFPEMESVHSLLMRLSLLAWLVCVNDPVPRQHWKIKIEFCHMSWRSCTCNFKKNFLCLLEWCFKDAEQRQDAKWSPVLKKACFLNPQWMWHGLFSFTRECLGQLTY